MKLIQTNVASVNNFWSWCNADNIEIINYILYNTQLWLFTNFSSLLQILDINKIYKYSDVHLSKENWKIVVDRSQTRDIWDILMLGEKYIIAAHPCFHLFLFQDSVPLWIITFLGQFCKCLMYQTINLLWEKSFISCTIIIHLFKI